jgi:hypothetical protein
VAALMSLSVPAMAIFDISPLCGSGRQPRLCSVFQIRIPLATIAWEVFNAVAVMGVTCAQQNDVLEMM